MFLRGTMASRESVKRWFYRFSRLFSVDRRFRDALAIMRRRPLSLYFLLSLWLVGLGADDRMS
jgi:hypothetical protein